MGTETRTRLRWWPAGLLMGIGGAVILWIRLQGNWSFQERNLGTLSTALGILLLLLLWWLTFSRAPGRVRLLVAGLLLGTLGLAVLAFRFHGVSGDLRPILQFRWARQRASFSAHPSGPVPQLTVPAQAQDYPQFLGPQRNAQLAAPTLQPDWAAHPPSILWRQPIGAGWSGWAIVGGRAFTQEQRGEGESVTCYEINTGRRLWSHADPVHYENMLAGEGPRATPTVAGNRVISLGATGVLNCLDATTGNRFWSRNIVEDGSGRVPEWGFAGSPLVYDGKVVVSAGGQEGHSLLAYSIENGHLLWHAGNRPASYSSPFLATVDGVRQIIAFNSRHISAHEAVSGQVLWEYPWGNGQPQVAEPVWVDTNRVLFSSGYGVGSELLEIDHSPDGHWAANRIWQSRKMKAKFANLVQRDGFLYGLDDGILACVDLKDGSQRWKEGRYGHGQGLLVGNLFVLMAENGELVLLQPTAEGPHELHRFRVFNAKTWNPIALSGELLLARNDQEAACVRLPID